MAHGPYQSKKSIHLNTTAKAREETLFREVMRGLVFRRRKRMRGSSRRDGKQSQRSEDSAKPLHAD
jgi:hypothetical protein